MNTAKVKIYIIDERFDENVI